MAATACTALGPPRPREVVLTPASARLGVPPAHVFPRPVRRGAAQRRRAHAIPVFEERVGEPTLIAPRRHPEHGVARPLRAARPM